MKSALISPNVSFYREDDENLIKTKFSMTCTHYQVGNGIVKKIPINTPNISANEYRKILAYLREIYGKNLSDIDMELIIINNIGGVNNIKKTFRRIKENLSLVEPAIELPFAYVYMMDAFEFLKKVKSDSIDLIITDPPYPSMKKFQSGIKREWYPLVENEYFQPLLKEFFRVLKPDSHLYIFTDELTMFLLKDMSKNTGLSFYKNLVWNKMYIGMGYHYRHCFEYIMFFEKGKKQLNYNKYGDVLSFPKKMGKSAYPTEKPVEILKILIQQSSKPGDVILDPFVGSGSIMEACKDTKRLFIGSDIYKKSISFVKNRFLEN